MPAPFNAQSPSNDENVIKKQFAPNVLTQGGKMTNNEKWKPALSPCSIVSLNDLLLGVGGITSNTFASSGQKPFKYCAGN